MDFYWFTVKAAFDSSIFMSLTHSIPFLIVCFCTFVVLFFSAFIKYEQTNHEKNPQKYERHNGYFYDTAGLFFGSGIMAFLFYGWLTLPSMQGVTLKTQYYEPFSTHYYTQNIKEATQDGYSSYYQLKKDPDALKYFNEGISKKVAPGIEVFSKDIIDTLQPLYLECLKTNQEIKFKSPENFSIETILEKIEKENQICANSSAKKIVDENLLKI